MECGKKAQPPKFHNVKAALYTIAERQNSIAVKGMHVAVQGYLNNSFASGLHDQMTILLMVMMLVFFQQSEQMGDFCIYISAPA